MPKILPLSFQTTYAELLEQCARDAFNEAFPEAGTFVVKEVDGRRYWYFQLPASDGQKQRYAGPETPELLEKIEAHQQARTAERARRALVSTLVRTAGLPRPLPKIGDIVLALQTAGVFRLRGVLVGTIAYQTYPAMLGVRVPATSIATEDVDIAQFSDISIAVGETISPMHDVLRSVDGSFRPVPHLHAGKSTTYRAADGVRVDFLTPAKVRDTDRPRKLPALGTDAEQLPFLDFLIHQPEPAVILHGSGIYVLVPSPERYAVHKLIVAQRRIGPGVAKRAKDLLQAEALLDALVEVKPTELREVWLEAEGRRGKWPTYILTGLASLDATVRDRVLAVLGKPRSAIPGLAISFDGSVARNDFDRDAIMLWANANKQRIRCIVARTVLEDHYRADGLDGPGRLVVFHENRREIEALLRQKYLFDPVEEPAMVILKTLDVDRLRAGLKKAR